jgi:ribosomal-protein-alanine N-acetyltransferase
MGLPLKTRRLEIREFESGDFLAIHACASDPMVTRWFPWGPNTESETRDFLEGVVRAATLHARASYVLAVVSREHGLIGCCLLDRKKEREFELGYYVHRDHWNQGFAAEAVEAVVPFAFRELEAHRILARVDPGNPTSARVLERIDFRLDDRVRRDQFIKGEWRDSLLYVLVAEEWRDA